MKHFLFLVTLISVFTSCNASKDGEMSNNFYDFSALNMQGEEVGMDAYKGKVVLVVNTASKCGFTPQFEGLEQLYKKYKDQGFIVLGFPCNQFGSQDPGTNDEIREFCQVNYGVSFPMFSKIEVNGKGAHPIYKFLKTELPGSFGKKIKWNFTKFLVSKDGKPLKRHGPTVKPENIEEDIVSALK